MRCGNNQTNCNCECIIAPLSKVFLPKQYQGNPITFGGIWQCPKCGWHSFDYFPTDKDIDHYKKLKER